MTPSALNSMSRRAISISSERGHLPWIGVSPALKATVTPGSRASRLTLEQRRGLIPPPGSLPAAPRRARLRQRTGAPGTWPRGVRKPQPRAQPWAAGTPHASCGARTCDWASDVRVLMTAGPSCDGLIFTGEPAEGSFSADPVPGQVDLRRGRACLGGWELAEGAVGPGGVVVMQVLGQDLAQVALIK